MRVIVLFVVAVLIVSAPAFASWKEYPQPQLGFAVEFPSDPTTSTANYKTELVPSAVAHIFSVKEEHAHYAATVVDLAERKEQGSDVLGEAEAWLRQLGDVTSVSVSRVEPGIEGAFGRFMTIKCRGGRPTEAEIGQSPIIVRYWFKSITGSECPDGSQLVVNLFFHHGRLYLIQGLILPTTEDTMNPSALRFANSISFFAADGTRNPIDTAR